MGGRAGDLYLGVRSVARLGRSLRHLVGFLEELDAAGCDLYLHQQALTWGGSGQVRYCQGDVGKSPVFAPVSKVRAQCMTRPVSEHDQPHIRSPFMTAAPTSRLRRARPREAQTILQNGGSHPPLSSPPPTSTPPPAP